MRASRTVVIVGMLFFGSGSLYASQSTPFDTCFDSTAEYFGIAPSLLKAIGWVESRFDPDAVSKKGAIGVMQVHSWWFSRLPQGVDEKALRKPCVNIVVGAWILSQEIGRFGATWRAVAAYNTGAGRLDRMINSGVDYVELVQRAIARF
ncbi:MAG: lytic transglycosylase domain-containing protein [Gammaproteobacteria bacterium]